MHLLDQTAPGLAAEIQRLEPLQVRKCLRAGLTAVVAGTKFESEFRRLFAALDAPDGLNQELVSSVRALSEAADELYLELHEAGAAEADWLNEFTRARLYSAVAIVGSSGTEAADAFYELIKSVDDPTDLIRTLWAEISRQKR